MVETVQSLIVAFVLAMTFRGFVVEGFVIPTGSMAPTLMGAHARIDSRQTGWNFAVGMDTNIAAGPVALPDPMLGPGHGGAAIVASAPPRRRMGDRILVLKCLYPFAEPDRFDVVVFKNPTRSQGDEANYIKRLIGLPNEDLWLCDGDVFARPHGEDDFAVQRKPEHVQRAVWQPVHDSAFVPVDPDRLGEETGRRYLGPPWVGSGNAWNMQWRAGAGAGSGAGGGVGGGRAYRAQTDQPTELRWDNARRELNDWTPYNLFGPMQDRRNLEPVSDLRVIATIVPDRDGLVGTLELAARSHIFEFTITPDQATMRMRRAAGEDGPTAAAIERTAALPDRARAGFRAGRPLTIECWHVDQSMRMFVDGREAMPPLSYDWTPVERLQHATEIYGTSDAAMLLTRPVQPPRLRWIFHGSPLTIERLCVDRDLFYRRTTIHGGRHDRPGFATHPSRLAELGPDHYMMLGDNSQASLDSRFWDPPDLLVSTQIDDTPNVVHRKLLLGKAWVVYFPALYPVGERGVPVIPDFGRLRFIR